MPVTEAEAVKALPPKGWLREYVCHAALQTTAPLVYHIGMGISLLGVTTSVNYGMHYAGALRANHFVLLVGRSGEDQKSSALRVGQRILDAAAAPLIGDFPGSPEGLIESLAETPSQLIPISEYGKFLSSAQRGYFEPIKTVLADVWDCLDEKTEILTASGWKGMDEVEIGEDVWSLDPDTERLCLTPALDSRSRRLAPEERMVKLEGAYHDIRTTEGHRFYIKYRDPKSSYRPSSKFLIKTGAELVKRKSSFYLPYMAKPELEREDIELHDDELKLTVCSYTLTDPGNKKSIRFSFDATRPGERVWCVTTALGTLVTRRNGKVVILGNCGPQQRRRANNKIIRCEAPRLSISAACSIPYLEKHTLSEDWTGGFMGRWLVLYGRCERSVADPVGDDTRFQFLATELQKKAVLPAAGWCQGLDPAAKQYWEWWYRDVTKRQLPSNIMGIRSRAPTMARKIALTLAWDYGPAPLGKPWFMDMSILEPAVAIAELHVTSLVHLSEVIAEHADARLRRSVLIAIDQKGGVATLGEILGVLKMRKRPIMEMLDALMEEGRVRLVETQIGTAYENLRSMSF